MADNFNEGTQSSQLGTFDKYSDVTKKALEDLGVASDFAALDTGAQEAIDAQDAAAGSIENDPSFQQTIDELKEREKYGSLPYTAAAAGLGAAKGLTFGLSTQLLEKAGVDQETLRRIVEANPNIFTAADIGATVAGTLATGGLGGAAKGVQLATKAGLAGEKAVASALATMLGQKATKSVASKIIEKSLPLAAGSAVEGAMYSVGDLLNENALGRADFNAENVLSSVGTGALFGGVAGGVIGGLAVPATKAAKGVVDSVDYLKSKLVDPDKAFLQLHGYTTQGERTKWLRKNGEAKIAELTDVLKNDAELLESFRKGGDDYVKGLDESIKRSNDGLNTIYTKIDNAAKTNPLIAPTEKDYLLASIKEIDDVIGTPDKVAALKRTGNDSQINILNRMKKDLNAELKNVVDYEKRTGNLKTMDASKMRQYKSEFGERAEGLRIKRKVAPEKPKASLEEITAWKINNILNKKIEKSALDAGGQSLLDELQDFNKQITNKLLMKKGLPEKAIKDATTETINMKDALYGAISANLGNITGPAVVAGSKVINSDMYRRFVVLKNIEKQNQVIQRQTKSAISNFFSKPSTKTAAKNLAVRTSLLTSKLGQSEDGKKPKNPEIAYENARQNIEKLVSNPKQLQETLARNTETLASVAPDTAFQTQQASVRMLHFLNSKLYDRRSVISPLDILNPGKKYPPPKSEIAKFERYLQAVENPMSVLDNLNNGTLTREEVEAVQVVYPDIYSRMVSEASDYIAKTPDLSYQKKIKLGTLMNINAHHSLMPQAFNMLQTNFVQQEQQAPQPQKFDSNASRRNQTSLEAAATRGQRNYYE